MVRVCILIRIQAGKSKNVLAALKQLKELKKLFAVFGRYDFVALANVADHKAALSIARKINAIPGLRGTETLLEA
jgi:uncharacterized protein with GYD domain